MVTNFYPLAGDGGVTKYSAIAHDWANVIAAASGTSFDYTSAALSTPNGQGGVVDTYCGRAFWAFDTTSLVGAKITAVTFNGYVTSYNNSETWYIIASSQSSGTTLENDDYNNITKGTLYGSTAISGTGVYTTTLTTTSVNAGGITKFAQITNYDYDSSEPPGQNINTQNFTEAGSNRPYLTVTYTPAGGAFIFNLI